MGINRHVEPCWVRGFVSPEDIRAKPVPECRRALANRKNPPLTRLLSRPSVMVTSSGLQNSPALSGRALTDAVGGSVLNRAQKPALSPNTDESNTGNWLYLGKTGLCSPTRR